MTKDDTLRDGTIDSPDTGAGDEGPSTTKPRDDELKKIFDPWRFGAHTMPPDLRRELIAAELPVHPHDRVYRPEAYEDSKATALDAGEAALRNGDASSLAPVEELVRVDDEEPAPTAASRRRTTSQKVIFGLIAALLTFAAVVMIATQRPRTRQHVTAPAPVGSPAVSRESRNEPAPRVPAIPTMLPTSPAGSPASLSSAPPSVPEERTSRPKQVSKPTPLARPNGPRSAASSVRAPAQDVDAPLFPTSKN